MLVHPSEYRCHDFREGYSTRVGLKRTQHSIVYAAQYISLIGLKRIQHSIYCLHSYVRDIFSQLFVPNQIPTQFSLDYSLSFQVF
jgi:hypothetical protein